VFRKVRKGIVGPFEVVRLRSSPERFTGRGRPAVFGKVLEGIVAPAPRGENPQIKTNQKNIHIPETEKIAKLNDRRTGESGRPAFADSKDAHDDKHGKTKPDNPPFEVSRGIFALDWYAWGPYPS